MATAAPSAAEQFGVLPYRVESSGAVSILLITSRDTGRWIIPKGNPDPKLSPQEAARLEAHEEAGVEGEVGDVPVGTYRYVKEKRAGQVMPVDVRVFPLKVTRQLDDWPERHERSARWFSIADAAGSVAERSLRALILSFKPVGAVSPVVREKRSEEGASRGFGMLNVFRAIMPKEDRFFDMFRRHADILVAGADTMVAMFSGEESVAESCRLIAQHEHAADDVTRDVLVAVRRSFITPFDRSAITALASAMDDSLDEMWQTAKAITLYEVESFEPQLLEMSQLAAEAARLVREGVPLLKHVGRNAHRLHQITEAIVHLEGRADELHAAGLKAIYQAHGAKRPMAFFIGREIFSHVERVLDRLEDVADEMQGIVIDHA
jgi:predicted phosphate transport protein (TIGR00153 family)